MINTTSNFLRKHVENKRPVLTERPLLPAIYSVLTTESGFQSRPWWWRDLKTRMFKLFHRGQSADLRSGLQTVD